MVRATPPHHRARRIGASAPTGAAKRHRTDRTARCNATRREGASERANDRTYVRTSERASDDAFVPRLLRRYGCVHSRSRLYTPRNPLRSCIRSLEPSRSFPVEANAVSSLRAKHPRDPPISREKTNPGRVEGRLKKPVSSARDAGGANPLKPVISPSGPRSLAPSSRPRLCERRDRESILPFRESIS